MALFAKDSNEILQKAIDFLSQNTALNATSPGSKVRAIAETLKTLTADAYTVFDTNVAIGFVYGASGKYLEWLGDIFGLQKRKASTADASDSHQVIKFFTIDGTFGSINNNQDIVIPYGTEVWAELNGAKVRFTVSSEVTLPKNDSEKYISVSAILPGAQSNVPAGAVRYHNFNSYADFKRGVLRVLNLDSIANGQDEESDDNFRFRIINNKLSAMAANETAIRLAALSVPGVADVRISDRYFGAGTAYVFIKSTTPMLSEAILARVQEEIDVVKAGGFNVLAMGPDYKYVEVELSVAFKDRTTADEIEQARESIRTVITSYINNLDIAEPLIINEMANRVFSSHPKIKSIGIPGRYFDRITVLTPVMSKYMRYNTLTDYTPGSNAKLLASSNAITIR